MKNESSKPIISIRHLKKTFGSLTVLSDVNAEIRRGEVISIIGPSGTGKSTLLRCLNLLETPTEGEIRVDGINVLDSTVNVSLLRRKMGMVFQQFNLFGHLSVLENLTFVPKLLLKLSDEEATARALDLLEKVNVGDKADALPCELSGGQQQRVAIARALAMNPEIIMFDEPTSALDPTMVNEVLEVLQKLAKTGITLLIVTHEMRFARNVSDRVFYMDEGVIYEEGPAKDLFDAPKRSKTQEFIRWISAKDFEQTRKNYDRFQKKR